MAIQIYKTVRRSRGFALFRQRLASLLPAYGRWMQKSALAPSAQLIVAKYLNQEIENSMTFVVTKACIGCKDTACVDVCPCEAFHEGPEMLYINPDHCIDCAACAPECPVEAIFHEDDIPDDCRTDTALNEKMSQVYPVMVK